MPEESEEPGSAGELPGTPVVFVDPVEGGCGEPPDDPGEALLEPLFDPGAALADLPESPRELSQTGLTGTEPFAADNSPIGAPGCAVVSSVRVTSGAIVPSSSAVE